MKKDDFVQTLIWLKKFFLNYFWFGIVVLLVSIILDLKYPLSERCYLLSILIQLFSAIGISILIASVFTFASASSDFVNKIKSLLEDIVIRRNFLSNIDPESKKEAIKTLIQPSIGEKNKYPNIGDYYGHFIDKTLRIAYKSVRSNYQINARASYDRVQHKVVMESIISYRVYPSMDGFCDVILGFEDEVSYCEYVCISNSDGGREVTAKPALAKYEDEDGDITYRTNISVKNIADGKNHIDVEFKIVEYGFDHWLLMRFKALQPTDGFKYMLRCDDDIVVKKPVVFVVGAKYYMEISPDNKCLNISCNQWINEGSGICVLISRTQNN